MITNFLLQSAYWVLEKIASWFSLSTGYPAIVGTSMTQLGGYYQSWNGILPITTLNVLLLLSIALRIVIWQWKNIKWLMSHIPFIGGHGK